jgi:hypothetical protein
MIRFLIFLAVLPLAMAADANEIVKRFIAASNKNWERASQYTYTEQADHFAFEKGKPKKDGSETYEIFFVEGETFKKLIARNDKPLDRKEQSKEDKRQQQTAEDRRKKRGHGLLHKQVSLGTYDDLLTLFDNRLLPDEDLHGHPSWVILSTPKAGHVPANTHEKEVLSFQQKYWINQADDNILKEESTVVGQHVMFAPGSRIAWEFEKINDEAWMAASGLIDGHLQFAKLIKPAVRTEYRMSKFQRFDVQSTITINP